MSHQCLIRLTGMVLSPQTRLVPMTQFTTAHCPVSWQHNDLGLDNVFQAIIYCFTLALVTLICLLWVSYAPTSISQSTTTNMVLAETMARGAVWQPWRPVDEVQFSKLLPGLFPLSLEFRCPGTAAQNILHKALASCAVTCTVSSHVSTRFSNQFFLSERSSHRSPIDCTLVTSTLPAPRLATFSPGCPTIHSTS